MEHPLDIRNKRQIRKWHDPRVALLMSSKTNAKNQGVEHSLSKEDIVIPEFCPVFAVKLIAGGRTENSMSLDRVNPLSGYIKTNVRVISWRANRLKNNASLEELERIVEYIRSHK